ncbi:hypothetical protein EUX98_g9110 [Antrodiella citrinella]|uniref:Uncharacterized protein n=1 Tax=Antrodiella citrinella TaxID=2447956 RepID=A0A4S4LXZ2_9APHY|nr:hypothetical protein EUX98_g9110 [Antrodiella citrinella]
MDNNDHRRDIGADIGGSFVNPCGKSVATFFKTFMPLNPNHSMPKFNGLKFPGLPRNAKENALYKRFASQSLMASCGECLTYENVAS